MSRQIALARHAPRDVLCIPPVRSVGTPGKLAARVAAVARRLRALPAAVVRRFGRKVAAEEVARLQADLARSEALYRLVAEHVSDVILCLAGDCIRTYVSPSCRAVLGFEPAALVGGGALDLLHPDDVAAARAILAGCGRDGAARHAMWRVRHQDGTYLWMAACCRYLSESGCIAIALRDVTEALRTERRLARARFRLERMATSDPLTRLLNRGSFLRLISRHLAADEPLAVFLIDLDRFKAVKDAHGHRLSETVLRAIGKRLTQAFGPVQMAARLGGDEFAAMLRCPDGDTGIAAFARDLLRDLSAAIEVAGVMVDVGASIGIAVSPRDGTDSSNILRSADIAMMHAKSAGGGCYRFFEPPMGVAVEQIAALKQELPAAVAAGELVPYFQPLVRMEDTTLVGFEVLARWEHPDHGTLPPARFLPLVEELGLSADMFRALLTRACTAARDWPAHIRLAMNISPRELKDTSLPDAVCRILESTGFAGTRLEIEITEEALIGDTSAARAVLERLRALGISVALDDFGTGFSSLYHLRELPFDKVKIDKSFMRSLDTDAEGSRYVAAIIGLGHALDLELTAEGIEDEPTMRLLQALGCTYGQGYLFGRPVAASDACRIVSANDWPALAAE